MRVGSSSEGNVPRILVIDDNVAIHQDFLKVLGSSPDRPQQEFIGG
jgi:hypothetical protein